MRLTGADLPSVERVAFYLRGRRVARDRRAPFARSVSIRRVSARRTLLRAHVATLDGRRLTLDRRVRRCR